MPDRLLSSHFFKRRVYRRLQRCSAQRKRRSDIGVFPTGSTDVFPFICLCVNQSLRICTQAVAWISKRGKGVHSFLLQYASR